jgi:hypothetical protein
LSDSAAENKDPFLLKYLRNPSYPILSEKGFLLIFLPGTLFCRKMAGYLHNNSPAKA